MAKFNAMDRCDQCSAQAWVSVAKDDYTLMFCAHHYDKHSVPLGLDGWTIKDDNRESMNTKASQSSA